MILYTVIFVLTIISITFIALYVNERQKKCLTENDLESQLKELIDFSEDLLEIQEAHKAEYKINNYVFSASQQSPKHMTTILPLTQAQLEDSVYNNTKSLYLSKLNELVYSFCENHTYNRSMNGTYKSWITNQLPVGSTCELLLVSTANNLDGFNWFNSYAGFIIKQVLQGKDYHFIIFRGTINQTDWYENIKVFLQSAPYLGNGVKVHTGFNNLYKNYSNVTANGGPVLSMRDQVRNFIKTITDVEQRVIISGHSMGAALGSLCVLDLVVNKPFTSMSSKLLQNLDFYGFSTPYFVNKNGSEILKSRNRNYSIQNTNDIVASKGFIFYVRTPTFLCCFNGPKGAVDSHILPTYIAELNAITGGKTWDTNAHNVPPITPLGLPCK
jgi:hypothetical protein